MSSTRIRIASPDSVPPATATAISNAVGGEQIRAQAAEAVLGMQDRQRARAVATQSVSSLSGAATIDGVALNTNDMVLLVAQGAPGQNGLWVVSTSAAWTRPTTYATGSNAAGMEVLVTEGTNNAQSVWSVVGTGPFTIDTNPVTWQQMSGLGQVSTSGPLTKTKNTLGITVGEGGVASYDDPRFTYEPVPTPMVGQEGDVLTVATPATSGYILSPLPVPALAYVISALTSADYVPQNYTTPILTVSLTPGLWWLHANVTYMPTGQSNSQYTNAAVFFKTATAAATFLSANQAAMPTYNSTLDNGVQKHTVTLAGLVQVTAAGTVGLYYSNSNQGTNTPGFQFKKDATSASFPNTSPAPPSSSATALVGIRIG